MSYRIVAFALSIAAVAACLNPVHSDAVAALGDEAAGVRQGPTHRPGQPCLTCHGDFGPGPAFDVAGTVFQSAGGTAPAVGVTVKLTDAAGKTFSATTNTAGNFYVDEGRFAPEYPVRIAIVKGATTQEMLTRMGRRGGCADCHRAGGSQALSPQVYLEEK